MPVDYAEPTQLQNFKVEVFQPRNDTPTLVKQPNNPTYDVAPGQLSVPNRDSGLGKPNNLPDRQQSLRNNGQYRTIDVTPNTTAKPAPSKQFNQLSNGTAGEAAIAEVAYYAGFLIDGIIDGVQNKNFENDSLKLRRTVLEDISYKTGNMAGKEARDLTEDAVKSAEKLLNDLWRNKPAFEIPQIKIPKFDLPGLPNLQIPKFPEFKFPEISFPKPQPIPIPIPKPPAIPIDNHKTIFLPTGKCEIFFACYEPSILQKDGLYYLDSGTYLPGVDEAKLEIWSGGTDEEYPDWLVFSNYFNPKFIYESTGDTCGVYDRVVSRISDGKIWKIHSWSFYYEVFTYPGEWRTVEFPVRNLGSKSDPIFKKIGWDFLVSNCALSPEFTLPPPPPPPEDDCCRMGCCPKPTEIDYRLIKKIVDQTLKEQKFPIEVPICKCEYDNKTNKWLPKTDSVIMEVFATSPLQAYQLAQLHLENARQAADLCLARNNTEAVAAIPQSWQIRHEGNKPQLVIQCAEKKEDGKYGSAVYPITVPHWKGGVNDKPPLPAYKKGNWEGILVLADNSKITINAANEAECTKILNAIKPWIKSEMLKNSYFKGGKINADIKPTQVKPMYGRYFSTGQKNNKPDWRIDFA